MRKKQYIICVADDLTELEEEVNRQIKKGYQPTGGVAIGFNQFTGPMNDKEVCTQAMILVEPIKAKGYVPAVPSTDTPF